MDDKPKKKIRLVEMSGRYTAPIKDKSKKMRKNEWYEQFTDNYSQIFLGYNDDGDKMRRRRHSENR